MELFHVYDIHSYIDDGRFQVTKNCEKISAQTGNIDRVNSIIESQMSVIELRKKSNYEFITK